MLHAISIDGASCELRVNGGIARVGAVRADDADALRRLLAAAARLAKKKDAASMLGPIGSDTWGEYRLVSFSDGTPAFPGEPTTPDWMHGAWVDAGFSPSHAYCSAVDDQPVARNLRPPSADVLISNWASCGSEHLLVDLHAMSETAFATAPLFSPIPLSDFVSRFAPLLSVLARNHSYVATRSDRPVGFLLGYPDGAGGHVLKTLVSTSPGLGSHLVDRFYIDAIAAGTRRVVHALMHDDNASVRMSRKFDARIFRRYALLEKDLSA